MKSSKTYYHVVGYVVVAAVAMFSMFQINSEMELADRAMLALGTLLVASVLGFVLAYLLRSLNVAVESDPNSLKVVASCANSMEASAVISHLENCGIEAKPMGEYTSSFQVEAPGDVKVVVRKSDLKKAAKIVASMMMAVQPADH